MLINYKVRRNIICVVTLILLGGCLSRAMDYKYYYPPDSSSVAFSPANSLSIRNEIQTDKNYKLRSIGNAYVGEPMIRRKSYEAKVQSELKATPLVNTTLTSSEMAVYLDTETRYPIKYKTNRGGRDYSVFDYVHPENGRIYHVLFDENGLIYPKVLYGDAEMREKCEISPLTAKMKPAYYEKTISRRNTENYELIFAGISNNQISMMYREYTSGDIARPAYYQQLTYPIDSEHIRYKSLKIKIHDVNSERISYEVVEE